MFVAPQTETQQSCWHIYLDSSNEHRQWHICSLGCCSLGCSYLESWISPPPVTCKNTHCNHWRKPRVSHRWTAQGWYLASSLRAPPPRLLRGCWTCHSSAVCGRDSASIQSHPQTQADLTAGNWAQRWVWLPNCTGTLCQARLQKQFFQSTRPEQLARWITGPSTLRWWSVLNELD